MPWVPVAPCQELAEIAAEGGICQKSPGGTLLIPQNEGSKGETAERIAKGIPQNEGSLSGETAQRIAKEHGRRNLSHDAWQLIVGKLYNAEKQPHGGNAWLIAQNEQSTGETAERIAQRESSK